VSNDGYPTEWIPTPPAPTSAVEAARYVASTAGRARARARVAERAVANDEQTAARERDKAWLANLEAHGPAWAAGTPRTDEEAAVMLGQAEPRHALRERLASRKAAAEGRVVLEPSPRVTPGEPLPEATMPRAQWRATWRDAEVPVLCALRERFEASGAVPVIGTAMLYAPWADRYGALAPLRARLEIGDPLGLATLGGDVRGETWADTARQPRRDHAGPYNEPRGWCEGLSSAAPEARR